MPSKSQKTKPKTNTSNSNNGRLIGSVEVRPFNQSRILLGNFTQQKPPKGFAVELTPDPLPADSFTTEVLTSPNETGYRLMMHLANHGNTAITASVYHM